MTSAPELSCREFVEVVTDYLEGDLPPEARRAVDAHIAECGGCDAYLAQMRLAITAIGKLTDEGIEADALDRMVTMLRNRVTSHAEDAGPEDH
jgi:anti-sigma factor RsiW